MKIIKVTATGGTELPDLFLRQTTNHDGMWGDCHFYVNQYVEKCDWWIVCHFSALEKPEKVLCDPDHIVFISMEPHDQGLPQAFFDQFSKLVLCDREVSHRDVCYRNGLTWWVGIQVKHGHGHSFSATSTLDYDKLKGMQVPEKRSTISIICSNKNLFSGHQKRLDFIAKLQKHPISEYIDFYGGGFRSIPDKWDAIAPYQYHIVLENSVIPDYWSEKLGDAFLGFAFPIYYGCPNIDKYFKKDALQVIDIEDFDATVITLEYLINQGISQSQLEAMSHAREQVLDDYNIFQMMNDICAEPATRHEMCRLRPPHYFLEAWLNKVKKVLSRLFHRNAV
ncbi:MAG: glycosyltransferase family 10 [Ghiorsea sp.]|nr:glycosyltransferase family 10 [Ghiorsea sp.]